MNAEVGPAVVPKEQDYGAAIDAEFGLRLPARWVYAPEGMLNQRAQSRCTGYRAYCKWLRGILVKVGNSN